MPELRIQRVISAVIVVLVAGGGCDHRRPASPAEPAANPGAQRVAATPAASASAGELVGDGTTTSGRADLDGDGREDCWTSTYSGGSGYGGDLMTVRPGCGVEALSIDTFSSFGSFLGTWPLS